MRPDICENRGNIGDRRGLLPPTENLDGDPPENLVAQPRELSKWDRLDQHLEVVRPDDDRRSPIVEIAPKDAIGLCGLLPGDEGSAIRVTGIGVAGGGVVRDRGAGSPMSAKMAIRSWQAPTKPVR